MIHLETQQSNAEPRLSRTFTLILAIITGVTVANLYYNQPLLNLMAQTFHVRPSRLGVVPMLTQIGYASGLLFFVPLADSMERRGLIIRLLSVDALVVALMALAPNLLCLEVLSFLVGLFSVVPQIVVPLAADLASNRERGRVVGTIMSGLLIGVLLARTVSGLIGNLWGWHSMFAVASGFMVLIGIVARYSVPRSPSKQDAMSYRTLLATTAALPLEEPELVRTSLTGANIFAAFSAFWTTLTFLLTRAPYHFSASTIGLFGLLGVAGALIAPVAGRLADRRDPRITVSYGLLLAFSVLVWLDFQHNRLWALVLGILGLDLAVNGAQISNQSRIYAIRPTARARSNTVYMVSYFIGGSAGSGLGSLFWHLFRWNGVTAVMLFFIASAGFIHYWSFRRYHVSERKFY